MEEIRILYIDDKPEIALGKFLKREYQREGCEIQYSNIVFDSQNGYKQLLNSVLVREANIVVVDSKLFENHAVSDERFTGEEFKIVLKKFFPFMEIIVITQNEMADDIDMVSKYDMNETKSATEYYTEVLTPIIDAAIDSIIQYRILAKKLSNNNAWEVVLKERIMGTLEGKGKYEELTKEDIDTLIQAFKEVQEQLNG